MQGAFRAESTHPQRLVISLYQFETSRAELSPGAPVSAKRLDVLRPSLQHPWPAQTSNPDELRQHASLHPHRRSAAWITRACGQKENGKGRPHNEGARGGDLSASEVSFPPVPMVNYGGSVQSTMSSRSASLSKGNTSRRIHRFSERRPRVCNPCGTLLIRTRRHALLTAFLGRHWDRTRRYAWPAGQRRYAGPR